MSFIEVIDQVIALLQQRGRITYRVLKREFGLDDEQIEDLKEELIEGQELAVDKDGKVLIWLGDGALPAESSLSPMSPPAESASAPQPRVPEAERRQLTVMFCDLVGSTTLSGQLDPEELREVVRAYQETSAEIIERYEGYIAQYLGDGLLVYFGYPTAHEDDAARAVRAGLEITEALHALNSRLSQPIQVRIGIHTGPVVVGEMGGGERHEQLALGETPNIAARVQGKAEPNTVVISAATQRLIAGLFEGEDRGRHELKGIATPQPLYRVIAESTSHSRFEAAVHSGLTPIVGREAELQFLHQRWEQVCTGEGQAVLVSGEPGIGKSRLVQELKEEVTREGALRITFRCSSHHQNSALYPVIEHLQRLLQFERDDTVDTKLGKLQQALVSYRFPQADTVLLLAALLSLPQPEGFPALNLSAQKQKEKTQELLVRWLFEETDKTTVACTWEDLHWADPSTLELLTLCLDQLPTARMFVLLVSRPEFIPPWGTRSYLSQLTLSRLGRPQVAHMVERITGGRALPVEVVEQVAAKTDGVPLFVEELTKMIVESGVVRAVNSHYELNGSLSALAIPSTLQDSLMARLDRLATAKEVAQLGAAIGREFSYQLLQALTALDDVTLQHRLKQLIDAGLIYQSGLPPDSHYIFRHALIQDTAYQSLLKSTRQQIHRQTAQVLEARFVSTVEAHPELLAHHYTEAGLPEAAIPYWQRAGQRAAERSANAEAVTYLTTGIELLNTLPDSPQRAQQELALQTALGAPLQTLKGWGDAAVAAVYNRARELCQQVGDTPYLFPTLFGLWRFYVQRAEFRIVQELAEQLLQLAQQQQDPALLMEAHRVLAATLFFVPDFAAAKTHAEQAMALYDAEQGRSRAALFPDPPGVVCRLYVAHILWIWGYPDQARQQCYEALSLARKLSYPASIVYALAWTSILHHFRREDKEVQELAEEQGALAAEHGLTVWLSLPPILHNWALAMQGHQEGVMAAIHQGLAAYRAAGSENMRSYYLAMLAEASAVSGQIAEGQRALTEALTAVEHFGVRYYEAELHRLKGELLLLNDEHGMMNAERQTGQETSVQARVQEAEQCFHKAIDVARKQGAKSWELRAATSLARLWQQQGKTIEARALLAPVYNWFTEGFDTADLKDAHAVLDELGKERE